MGFHEMTPDLFLKVYQNLRASDKEEIKAAYGNYSYEDFLKDAFKSLWSKVYLNNKKEAVAVGGVRKTDINRGMIWFVATPLISDHAKDFAFLPSKVVKEVHKAYGINSFFNFVFSKNKKSLKWLLKNGFEVKGETLCNHEKFYYVERII